MTAIAVRPAAPADVVRITEVFLACWRQTYLGLLPDRALAHWTESSAARTWCDHLRRTGDHWVAVAETDQGVEGVIRYARDGGTAGTVESLYVHPDASGRGLGRLLLRSAIDHLRTLGCSAAQLWVFEQNGGAIAFYRRQGFEPDGRLRVQHEFGTPEVGMRLDLAAPSSVDSPAGDRNDREEGA